MPSTVEAQQNARNTSDLLRRFRELGERMRQVGLAAAGAAGQCQQRAPICVPVLVPGVGGWHGLHATLAHAFHPLQEYQSGAQPVLSEEEQRLRVRGGVGRARCAIASACCSLPWAGCKARSSLLP